MTTDKETATIAFRVDKSTKEAAEELFGQMGMSVGTALNIFLAQSVHDWRMPFQPSAERKLSQHLEKSIREVDDMLSGKKKVKAYNNFEELWEDL